MSEQDGNSEQDEAAARDPETERVQAVRRLLDQGQGFLGYDLVQAALRQFPGSITLRQCAARALLQTGALPEAQALLEEMDASSEGMTEAGMTDAETLGLLARAGKERWKRSGDPADALAARDAYLRGYRLSRSLWTGINAATLSWIVGDRGQSAALARQCLATLHDASQGPPPASVADRYWQLATQGEACLLLGRHAEALRCYREAAAQAGQRHALQASSRQQLNLLAAAGFPVPPLLLGLLAPPAVVVFAGHMLDRPGRLKPRFLPPQADAVKAEIARHLARIKARVGFSAAACGSDLLFIEAMQERGAETHILLPYAREIFVRASVAFAGADWVRRFDQALAQAASVRYITEEAVPGDESIFAVMGKMLLGYALLAAQPLDASLTLLAVWDGQVTSERGGTSDTVMHWPAPARRVIIPLKADSPKEAASPKEADPARRLSPAAALESAPLSAASLSAASSMIGAREIKTLLFADVVGYSKLQEDRMPAFMYQFLQRIAGHLAPPPRFVNTWGDAIFALMDTASDLADYALTLQDSVCDTDWAEFGLPAQMSVRIGLHAGPVFAALDPITGMPNYYGSHVNRAARLEAVTVPGQVYVSEPFAALLTAEQQASEQSKRCACDYIGSVALHKNFGQQPIYHLRRV